MVSDKKVMTFG